MTEEVERHLPRNTCPLIKSLTGFKLGHVCPYIESSDLVVGENTCDGKKKAYEFFGTQKPMHIMDVPNVKNEGTKENWKREARKLAERVEQETGSKITAESLKHAIHIVNEKRRTHQRLSAARAADPAPISGRDSFLTVQAAFMDDAERLTGAVNEMVAECGECVCQGIGATPKGAKRILYTVTPMAVPFWKLYGLIEGAGAVVVGEECCTGYRYYKDLVGESGETAEEMLDATSEPLLQHQLRHLYAQSGTHRGCPVPCQDAPCGWHHRLLAPVLHALRLESFTLQKAAEDVGIPHMHISTTTRWRMLAS